MTSSDHRLQLASGADLLAVARDALARVAVIVCELEIGETSTAYMVATDLELDLEAAIARATCRRSSELRAAA
jgi:hypothetical protein